MSAPAETQSDRQQLRTRALRRLTLRQRAAPVLAAIRAKRHVLVDLRATGSGLFLNSRHYHCSVGDLAQVVKEIYTWKSPTMDRWGPFDEGGATDTCVATRLAITQQALVGKFFGCN